MTPIEAATQLATTGLGMQLLGCVQSLDPPRDTLIVYFETRLVNGAPLSHIERQVLAKHAAHAANRLAELRELASREMQRKLRLDALLAQAGGTFDYDEHADV